MVILNSNVHCRMPVNMKIIAILLPHFRWENCSWERLGKSLWGPMRGKQQSHFLLRHLVRDTGTSCGPLHIFSSLKVCGCIKITQWAFTRELARLNLLSGKKIYKHRDISLAGNEALAIKEGGVTCSRLLSQFQSSAGHESLNEEPCESDSPRGVVERRYRRCIFVKQRVGCQGVLEGKSPVLAKARTSYGRLVWKWTRQPPQIKIFHWKNLKPSY